MPLPLLEKIEICRTHISTLPTITPQTQRSYPKQAMLLVLRRWALVDGVDLRAHIIDPTLDPIMDPIIRREI